METTTTTAVASVTAFATTSPQGLIRYDVDTAGIVALSVPRAVAFDALRSVDGLENEVINRVLAAAEMALGFRLVVERLED